MGVKNLFKFLRDNCPQYKSLRRLEEFAGRTVFIDTSCLLYKYLSFTTYYSKKEDKLKSMTASDGTKTAHLRGIASLIKSLSVHDIEPVFVVDGEAGALKSQEVA